MKHVFFAIVISVVGCNPSGTSSVSQRGEPTSPVAVKPKTLLRGNTFYSYRSSFPEFRQRIQWIAKTDPVQLRVAAESVRKTRSSAKDIGFRVLSGDLIGTVIEASGVTRDKDGNRRVPWWIDPLGAATESPLSNSVERTLRSLPKLDGDGIWATEEIESIDFHLDDPAKEIFQEMARYNSAGASKTEQAQPQARVVASATALVFRESDASILFINGIKWNHPLYADGYTEFHLHISQKTGAVINDAYAYTTFPLEPGQFSQYESIARTTVDAVKLARQLLGN
jgi:hypothetical protein